MDEKIWFDACNVQVKYQRRFFFNNLTLKFRLGESTALLGPNGAGKSSITKLINRELYPIVKPNSHLKLFGNAHVNIWQLRKRIGILNTELEARFLPTTTSQEIVLSAFFGAMRLGRDQRPTDQQQKTVEKLLNSLHLETIKEKSFGELSDGERRRLMLARAIVHQPEVLILDEPTRALDLKACHQLLSHLRALCQKGTTLLLITHRIETILPEINRILFLKKGKIVGDGQADTMLSDQPLSDLFETPLSVVHQQGFHQVLPK